MKQNQSYSSNPSTPSQQKMDYSKFITHSMSKVPRSGIRKYFDIAEGIEDVISLGVGEPDFVTPWHIREMCIHSIEKGETAYTSNFGLLELREEIAKRYKNDYGLYYDPKSEILVTTGVSEAADLALRCLIDPGDEVLVVQPAYVSYVPLIYLAGGVPVPVNTKLENDFRVTPEDLRPKITQKTKAIVFNYPNNPTGAIMTRKDFEAIADVIIEHDLFVISDEVYECMTYEGTHVPFTALEGMKERTILLNGFSKSYSMTGFRLGYALAPAEIISAMMLIHQYCMLCAPVTAQIGAIEALKNGREEMLSMIREFDRRRVLIVDGFNKLGLDCFEPKGAFYSFPSIRSTGLTSEEFADQFFAEKHVITIPGNIFGDTGTGHMRCAYAASRDDIKDALGRLEDFLNKKK
ncbi:aminotransferase class I/II-fold pyridoxal phosphate-dependent enzyme [Methanolapillus millepedarum]|uniref:Aminotransferase n=1 Tax=Methanolapillus millepedarum TaxID=3028296 RepID=A0AA97A3S3_9EURY|nr:putative N-acetyl-LL-diaminopimelate aminotransferase [Methanosarcinaceae archaeon Ac7]